MSWLLSCQLLIPDEIYIRSLMLYTTASLQVHARRAHAAQHLPKVNAFHQMLAYLRKLILANICFGPQMVLCQQVTPFPPPPPPPPPPAPCMMNVTFIFSGMECQLTVITNPMIMVHFFQSRDHSTSRYRRSLHDIQM